MSRTVGAVVVTSLIGIGIGMGISWLSGRPVDVWVAGTTGIAAASMVRTVWLQDELGRLRRLLTQTRLAVRRYGRGPRPDLDPSTHAYDGTDDDHAAA